ncbi:MAG: leucine-rich repeat protein, partial [Dysgonamonadaceae bacterium]|nr:leucine-rich repeat protein [Dysgonamonadaceae bacterium]
RAFFKCSNLKDINLPNGLKNIGTGVFQDTKVEISALPESIETLGGSVFVNCPGATFSVLPSGLKSIQTYTFSMCPNITVTRIPDKITSIPNYALRGCTKITEMTFPAGLTSIGQYGFTGTPLTKITFLGVNPPTIIAEGATASFSNPDQIDVIVPAGTPLDGGSPWKQAPWTEFKSVTESQSTVSNLAANIAGQGISIRPSIVSSEIYLSGDNIAPIIRIYNTTGQEVLKVKVDGQYPVISVAQLTPGVYLLKAGDVSLKFIKK